MALHRGGVFAFPAPKIPRRPATARLSGRTLSEQGIEVELFNWPGVFGRAGVTAAQADAMIATAPGPRAMTVAVAFVAAGLLANVVLIVPLGFTLAQFGAGFTVAY